MATTSLTLELRPGESVSIGRGVTLTVEKKTGPATRLRFLADSSVSIRKLLGEPRTGAKQARQGIRRM